MAENSVGTGYVCVVAGEEDEAVEVPAEENGTLLLSVLQSQFEGAIGLKFRNPASGAWRGVRISGDVLQPPTEGWSNVKYVVVSKPVSVVAAEERKEESSGSGGSYREREPIDLVPHTGGVGGAMLGGVVKPSGDAIVLGLKWEVTEEDLRNYFMQFGNVEHAEIKCDMLSGKSRGFGFVRFDRADVQDSVISMTHTIMGRRCELRHPRKITTSVMPCKFFVGCLPNNPEATIEELTEYFAHYGRLSDVYIPKPYRGFGFVTFVDGVDAQRMASQDHTLRGYKLNVNVAEPKTREAAPQHQQFSNYQVPPTMHNPGGAAFAGNSHQFSSFLQSLGHPRQT